MKQPNWKVDPVSGNWVNVTGKRITGLLTPSASDEPSTKGYADGLVANPNGFPFASSDSKYSQFVTPGSRSAYNAALGNGATLNCDQAMPTNNRLTRILFVVRVGDFAFDCTALAKRNSGGTVSLITANPKLIFTAADYTSPPAITLALSVSGTNVRLALTNSSGANQVVAMGSVVLEEDIS